MKNSVIQKGCRKPSKGRVVKVAMVYQWSGKHEGTIESGEMTATTREEVISLLRKEHNRNGCYGKKQEGILASLLLEKVKG